MEQLGILNHINKINPISLEPNQPVNAYNNISIQITEKSEIYEVNKEEELRIEVGYKQTVKILLLVGHAEIFGVALPLDPNHPIYISGKKIAIFCWKDSKIEIMGKPDICYIGKDTPMVQYLMGYYLIHEKRLQKSNKREIGPRVLIIGSKNSGKRSLTHTYLNYSLKHGFKPIYADVSLNNEIGIPGTIAATVVDNTFPCSDYVFENSIMFFNGYCNSICSGSEHSFSKDLYLKQIRVLGGSVLEKLEFEHKRFNALYESNPGEESDDEDDEKKLVHHNIPHEPQVFSSGSIIHCDSQDTLDLDLYKEVINSFRCDYVFILENDRLFAMLSDIFKESISNKEMTIIKLAKSSGVSCY